MDVCCDPVAPRLYEYGFYEYGGFSMKSLILLADSRITPVACPRSAFRPKA